MKLVLNPNDKHFKTNIAELHDAEGASTPTEYRVIFRGEKISTRGLRMQGDNLYALSADGLHEIVMPMVEVGEITVTWFPKHLMCIIAPSLSNGTTSCAILGIHPTREAAEWSALDYLSDRGFQVSNFNELLQVVRGHQQFDITCEEI